MPLGDAVDGRLAVGVEVELDLVAFAGGGGVGTLILVVLCRIACGSVTTCDRAQTCGGGVVKRPW